jgi:hypothetical protein
MNISRSNHSIQVEDDLIILILDGEFSERSAKAYVSDLQGVIEGFKEKPFLMLVDNLALKGATPEAYEESNKHNRWLSNKSMLGKATVYPSSLLADIDSARVTSKRLSNCKNFESIEEARNWLNSLRH